MQQTVDARPAGVQEQSGCARPPVSMMTPRLMTTMRSALRSGRGATQAVNMAESCNKWRDKEGANAGSRARAYAFTVESLRHTVAETSKARAMHHRRLIAEATGRDSQKSTSGKNATQKQKQRQGGSARTARAAPVRDHDRGTLAHCLRALLRRCGQQQHTHADTQHTHIYTRDIPIIARHKKQGQE